MISKNSGNGIWNKQLVYCQHLLIFTNKSIFSYMMKKVLILAAGAPTASFALTRVEYWEE